MWSRVFLNRGHFSGLFYIKGSFLYHKRDINNNAVTVVALRDVMKKNFWDFFFL